MLLNEVLDRNVRCYPEKEAIVYHERRYSYREFGENANRFTNLLLKIGMKRGDRVALLSKNSAEYLMIFFGTFRAGGAIIPLNWRLKIRELDYIVNQSDAEFLVFTHDFLEIIQKLRPKLKGVKHFILISGDHEVPADMLDFQKLMDASSTQRPEVDIHEGDVAIQMYTSGTTGYPKGALLTHRNITTSLYMGIISTQITRECRTLVVAPLFHIAAFINALTGILVGGTNVIGDQFDPVEVLKAFETERITSSFFAPTMLKMMVDVPGVKDYDFSSVQCLSFGGAPMGYDLLLECQRVFQCDFLNGFGQTEACPYATVMSQEEYREIIRHPELQYRLHSVGKDWPPGVEVRIVDGQDRDVEVGEVGEIIARSDTVMSGYYKMPEETARTLRNGWLHTGDMGKFDKDRYLYLVDRKKDMIISGGENIYPMEIENAIMELSGVVDVAVVGVPHEKWGEVPKAFVVRAPNADLTDQAIIAFCKENLAGYKCPQAVEFLIELPRNAAGKVLKTELRRVGQS